VREHGNVDVPDHSRESVVQACCQWAVDKAAQFGNKYDNAQGISLLALCAEVQTRTCTTECDNDCHAPQSQLDRLSKTNKILDHKKSTSCDHIGTRLPSQKLHHIAGNI